MGQQDLGAMDVVQPSRRFCGQRLHERALDAPSSQSPLGTLESFVVMASTKVKGLVTTKPPCPRT